MDPSLEVCQIQVTKMFLKSQMDLVIEIDFYLSGKELFIRFTARAFRKLLSVYVFSYLPFSFESRMWDLIVSVPDHCLSFYFTHHNSSHSSAKGQVKHELMQ